MSKFIIEPHFRLQEWVAEEKGYFRDEGLDYEFREFVRASGGTHHVRGDKVGAFQSHRKRPRVQRHLRLPLDGERGGVARAHEALRRCVLGRALRLSSCRRIPR